MVSVVVLSYNTREMTLKCVDFLTKSKGVEMEVIVVDNNSSDGSAEALAKIFPKVKLIRNKQNVGFAAGNNQAVAMAQGEWILLLNSDAFVYEESIQKLIKWAQENPHADVIGPQILNPDGTCQPSWGFFPDLFRVTLAMTMIDNLPIIRDYTEAIHVRSESRYKKPTQVDWVTGSVVLLKAEVWNKVGGIDPNFFMYGEEMEWMYRVVKAGYQIWFSPITQVVHIGRASSANPGPALIGEMKGWLYFWEKHKPGWQKNILVWLIEFGCVIRQVLKPSLALIYNQAMREIWDQTFGQSKKSDIG